MIWHGSWTMSTPGRHQGLTWSYSCCSTAQESCQSPSHISSSSASALAHGTLHGWRFASCLYTHTPKMKINKKIKNWTHLITAQTRYCLVSKTPEQVITEQLTIQLKEHCLISPYQYGLRKGQSASDLLLLAVTWHNVLDSEHSLLVIALDIAWTILRVWNRGFLGKLK